MQGWPSEYQVCTGQSPQKRSERHFPSQPPSTSRFFPCDNLPARDHSQLLSTSTTPTTPLNAIGILGHPHYSSSCPTAQLNSTSCFLQQTLQSHGNRQRCLIAPLSSPHTPPLCQTLHYQVSFGTLFPFLHPTPWSSESWSPMAPMVTPHRREQSCPTATMMIMVCCQSHHLRAKQHLQTMPNVKPIPTSSNPAPNKHLHNQVQDPVGQPMSCLCDYIGCILNITRN